jgi:antitoxin YobK
MVDELLDLIRAAGKQPDFSGPQSELAIRELENFFGISFPGSYRIFLQKYGGGFGFSGLYRSDPKLISPGTVLGDTIRMREKYQLGKQYIVVSESPLGVICCIDSSITNASHENPVVQMSFGPNGGISHCVQVSDSFSDFLAEILQIRLEVLLEESE